VLENVSLSINVVSRIRVRVVAVHKSSFERLIKI